MSISYENFCMHYEYDPKSEESKKLYAGYLKQKEIFSAIDLKETKAEKTEETKAEETKAEEVKTQTISIRLNKKMIEEIKKEGLKIDVPYQCLIKLWLAEKLKEKIN